MEKTTHLIFGNGFIGTHYASFLLKKKRGVRVIYRSRENKALPSYIQEKSRGSIGGIKKILLKYNPRYVLLTQGISFIPDTEKNLEESIAGNLVAPFKVLEAIYLLKKKGVRYRLPEKILTFGSSAEYGENEGKAFREESPTLPSSLYGLAKNWLYQLSQYYYGLGLPCVHLRQFNAIGARQSHLFAIASFCRQVALIEQGKKRPFIKVGNLAQKRDFIDIRDAIPAYEAVLRHAKPGQTVNICSGKSYFIKEIIEWLKNMTTVSFEVKIDPRLMGDRRTRSSLVIGNPRLIKKWGWKQRYHLQESVRWILEYWREAIK